MGLFKWVTGVITLILISGVISPLITGDGASFWAHQETSSKSLGSNTDFNVTVTSLSSVCPLRLTNITSSKLHNLTLTLSNNHSTKLVNHSQLEDPGDPIFGGSPFTQMSAPIRLAFFDGHSRSVVLRCEDAQVTAWTDVPQGWQLEKSSIIK